ncbi:MAG: hypothetical protein CM15mP54_09230 [Paracoccaceae bacterium]|nr:MAG: hypothetical protein CM15mP54_09230 [Paracoccaceae bacterium]
MKISTIKNVHILLLGLALTLFLNFSASFASNGNRCLNEDLDITNNLCEQNARHLALENNLSFVDKIFLKDEVEEPSDLIMEHLIPVRMNEDIQITSKETTLDATLKPNLQNWPRPKVVNRNFEVAVNSLDVRGKKDLISCAIMQTSESLDTEIGWETHQIDAVISFSNQKLPEFNFSAHRLASKHTSQGCQNLLSLVLGKT